MMAFALSPDSRYENKIYIAIVDKTKANSLHILGIIV